VAPIPFFVILIRFVRAFWRSLKDPEFQALFFLVLVTLVSGAVFYRQVEGWSLLDSLYFSVTTLTTVGYGDLSPSTAAGKIFTIFYIFVGVGLILGFLNAVAAGSTEGRRGILGRRRRVEEAEDYHHDDAISQSEKRG
jgi:voltage-gated potassium channel